MPGVKAYHRPSTLDEASLLLSEPGRSALAGGTALVPPVLSGAHTQTEVVDLQALGLDMIMADGDRLGIGSMVRLGDLLNERRVPTLLRQLAQQELPSALRNQATLGGTIGDGSRESVLLAGLLVHQTTLEIHGVGTRSLDDELFSPTNNRLITSITIHTAGTGSVASTGRTPADIPIVAAVANRTNEGVRLALTGVSATPVLVDPANPTAGLRPPSDFRGSSEYRLHLAGVLGERALAEVA